MSTQDTPRRTSARTKSTQDADDQQGSQNKAQKQFDYLKEAKEVVVGDWSTIQTEWVGRPRVLDALQVWKRAELDDPDKYKLFNEAFLNEPRAYYQKDMQTVAKFAQEKASVIVPDEVARQDRWAATVRTILRSGPVPGQELKFDPSYRANVAAGLLYTALDELYNSHKDDAFFIVKLGKITTQEHVDAMKADIAQTLNSELEGAESSDRSKHTKPKSTFPNLSDKSEKQQDAVDQTPAPAVTGQTAQAAADNASATPPSALEQFARKEGETPEDKSKRQQDMYTYMKKNFPLLEKEVADLKRKLQVATDEGMALKLQLGVVEEGPAE